METLFKPPQGTFNLSLHPQPADKSLRAWDAADEFLLDHLHREGLPAAPSHTLILNDRQGALTVALRAAQPLSGPEPVFMSDSFAAHRAAKANLLDNHLTEAGVRWLNCLQKPDARPDLVLLKIPHSLALLEDQLHRLRPVLSDETVVLGAGMSKVIHTSTLELFSSIVGPTRTSLARKKARLIFCTPDPDLHVANSPYPAEFSIAAPALKLINHAGVFSQRKADIGSLFMLDNLPETAQIDGRCQRVLDLGCGNGLLGIAFALANPGCDPVFCDDSFRAVASARENFLNLVGYGKKAEFLIDDCLDNYTSEPFDLILNNPPFHQQRVVSDDVAWKMFRQSRQHLREGGVLRVVGNRHLAYHAKLKKLFGNVKTVASNRKFVILDAVRHS